MNHTMPRALLLAGLLGLSGVLTAETLLAGKLVYSTEGLPVYQVADGVTIQYLNAASKANQTIRQRLQRPDAVPAMAKFVNEILRFNEPVRVLVGAQEGPLFDPETSEISLPYTFVDEIKNRFADSGWEIDEEEYDKISLDVVMHTLFHELGHALIWQYDLPLLGKEEDAVDALANVLLLEYMENGADIALNAADMFGLESEDVEEYEQSDFWDEHSLDIQRYYSVLCHVIGYSPVDYAYLVDDGLLSQGRADQCEGEYDEVRDSWMTLLQPWLRE